MALKATIYKADLQVSDLDRHYYQNHALTVARHPSETEERLMVRLAAFAHNAHPALTFAKGLSDVDEPDLWQRDLTGAIDLWIDVGLPDERRIIKASGRARKVIVYAYGGNAATLWWNQTTAKLARLNNVTVMNIPMEASKALALLARRNMQLQASIQDNEIMVTCEDGLVSVSLEKLKDSQFA
ncbi:MAG TPA: YaeQ family protein [Burkholderiales bacterium]|nr:YaeQ family protein [Burkholderiales bacterium]